MPNLYIINFKGGTQYNIVEGVNISQHFKLLEKYCPNSINDRYLRYNLKNDYKNTQTLLDTDEDFNFLTLIDTTFNENKIKNGWYQLEQSQLDLLIKFISEFIEPIEGGTITKSAEYICDSCNKQCIDKRTLIKHLAECPKLSNYKCPTCNKIFVSNTCYHTHILKCKTNEHICNICNKKLASEQTLLAHINNCGEFSCNKCNKKFQGKYKYRTHCVTIHGFTPII